MFIVPQGGDGVYYFSTYLLVDAGERALFNIRVNGEKLCTACGDLNDNGLNDSAQATCSSLVQLTEGRSILKSKKPFWGMWKCGKMQ